MPSKRSVTENNKHSSKPAKEDKSGGEKDAEKNSRNMPQKRKFRNSSLSENSVNVRLDMEAEGAKDYMVPEEKDGDILLEVECGPNKACLYLSKLCQGSKGHCVSFQGSWLTPNEFQYVSGRETAKDWKRSIRHHGKSIKLLFAKGILSIDDNGQHKAKTKAVKKTRKKLNQPDKHKRQTDSKQERVENENVQTQTNDSEQTNPKTSQIDDDDNSDVHSDSTENYELELVDDIVESQNKQDPGTDSGVTCKNDEEEIIPIKEKPDHNEVDVTTETSKDKNATKCENIQNSDADQLQDVENKTLNANLQEVKKNSFTSDTTITASTPVTETELQTEAGCVETSKEPLTATNHQIEKTKKSAGKEKTRHSVKQYSKKSKIPNKKVKQRNEKSKETKLGSIINQLRVNREKVHRDPHQVIQPSEMSTEVIPLAQDNGTTCTTQKDKENVDAFGGDIGHESTAKRNKDLMDSDIMAKCNTTSNENSIGTKESTDTDKTETSCVKIGTTAEGIKTVALDKSDISTNDSTEVELKGKNESNEALLSGNNSNNSSSSSNNNNNIYNDNNLHITSSPNPVSHEPSTHNVEDADTHEKLIPNKVSSTKETTHEENISGKESPVAEILDTHSKLLCADMIRNDEAKVLNTHNLKNTTTCTPSTKAHSEKPNKLEKTRTKMHMKQAEDTTTAKHAIEMAQSFPHYLHLLSKASEHCTKVKESKSTHSILNNQMASYSVKHESTTPPTTHESKMSSVKLEPNDREISSSHKNRKSHSIKPAHPVDVTEGHSNRTTKMLELGSVNDKTTSQTSVTDRIALPAPNKDKSCFQAPEKKESESHLSESSKNYNDYMKLLAAKQGHSPLFFPSPFPDPYYPLMYPDMAYAAGLYNPYASLSGQKSRLPQDSSSFASTVQSMYPFPPPSLACLSSPRLPYGLPYPILETQQQHKTNKDNAPSTQTNKSSRKRSSGDGDALCALDLSVKRQKLERENKRFSFTPSEFRSANTETTSSNFTPLNLKISNKRVTAEMEQKQKTHETGVLQSRKSLNIWSEVDKKSASLQCKCGADNPDNIMNWSSTKVYEFVSRLEGCSSYAKIFLDHKIEGKVLPLLTTDILIRNLGLKVGPAIILSEAVTRHVQDMSRFFHPCAYCRLKSSQRLSI